MHNVPVLALILTVVFLAGCTVDGVESSHPTEASPIPIAERTPVLVELFTSEGCSSCPPADRALALLETQQPVSGAEIITLAFHVDYWNNLGWKDAFSSSLFTQRQQTYTRSLRLDSAYTPQMIVDGRYEFVGSDLNKANMAIVKAESDTKGKIDLALNEGSLDISITEIPAHDDATVHVAIAESGLSSKVSGGENRGHKLEHSSVVRELKSAGVVVKDQKEFKSQIPVDLKPEYKRENVSLVVFVQENVGRGILAVGKIAAK